VPCYAVPQVYEDMVKQLEVSPLALRQAQEALAANPGALLPALAPAGGPIADLPSDQAALVWIQYMRFSRRSESVNASRKVRGAATVVARQSCSLGRVLCRSMCWSMCVLSGQEMQSLWLAVELHLPLHLPSSCHGYMLRIRSTGCMKS
jgi:hypothetical protein